MYLLYLDESGQHGGDYFVLAGAAIFERKTYWVANEFDQKQTQYFPEYDTPIEFHASPLRAGYDAPWDKYEKSVRYQIINEIYEVIADNDLTLFAVAIERSWLNDGRDEYSFALESLMKRFDDFLRDIYRQTGQPERGLMIIAESEYRRRIESIARKLVTEKTTKWGDIYNMAELPLFTSAANSRCLQLADFCANAVYGRYQYGYARHFDTIAGQFAKADSGDIYGLTHFSRSHKTCMCPACLSRRD